MKRVSIKLTSVLLLFALLVGVLASCNPTASPSTPGAQTECDKKGPHRRQGDLQKAFLL